MRWTTSKSAFVSWQLTLGRSVWSDPPSWPTFVREVLVAGRATEVYALGDERGPDEGVSSRWLASLADHPFPAFFPSEGPLRIPTDHARPWTRVSEGGPPIWFADVGDPVSRSEPDVRVDHVFAVELTGPLVYEPTSPMLFMVTLSSNLWLDGVVVGDGWMDEGPELGVGAARFNRFLASLLSAAESRGGTLRLDSVHPRYRDRVSHLGLM
jgi:hypothetical protein